MNFTINIDDEILQKSLERGVLNIDPKKVAEMSEQIIWQYLQKPNVIEALIFETDSFGYIRKNEPRKWFINIVKECLSMGDVIPFRNQLLNTINENGEKIVISTMAQVFSNMLITPNMQEQLSVAFSKAIGCN